MANHDFFMSYSSSDVEFVERLHNDLTDRGFSIWRDKIDIRAIDDWAKSIDQALRTTNHMIVVISKSSMKSEEVYREWSFFISRGKKLICVWMEDTDEIPYRLDPQQRIDFRSHADYKESLSSLIRELELLALQSSASDALNPDQNAGMNLITWEDIRQVASVFTQKMLDVRYAEKFDSAYYLQRQSISAHFNTFLTSDKAVMVLTGKAGTGKSGFICSLNSDKPNNLLVLLQDCAHLELASDTKIEDYLCQILGIKSNLISTLNNLYNNNPNYQIMFLFDAINEFKEREQLLTKISNFIRKIDSPAIKVMITSRIPIWDSIKRAFAVPLELEFHTSGPHSYVNMDSFTDDEVKEVYELYQKLYKFYRPFNEISEQVKNFLKQPLFMKLTAEAYAGEELPRTLVLREVFAKYVKSCLGKDGFEGDEYKILERAIQIMFKNAQRELSFTDLELDNIVGEKIVGKAYSHLIDAGIISERGEDKSLLRSVQMVFVTYERVFEFLLADITVGEPNIDKIEEYLDLAKNKSFVQLRGALELAVGFSIIRDNSRLSLILELSRQNRPDTRQFLVDVIQVVYDSGNQRLASDIIEELYDDDDETYGMHSKLLAAQAAYQLRFDDKLVKSALSPDKDLRDIAAIFIYQRWNKARLAGHLQDGYEPIRQLANSINLFRPKRAVRAISAFVSLAINVVPHAIEDSEAVVPLIEIAQQIVRQVPGLEPKAGQAGKMSFVGNSIVKAVAQALSIVSRNLLGSSVFDDEGVMVSFFNDMQSKRAFADCLLLIDKDNLIGYEDIIIRFTNWDHLYVYWLMRFPMLYHMTYQPEIHEELIQNLFEDKENFTSEGRISLAWSMVYGHVCRLLRGDDVPINSFSQLKDNFIELWYEIMEETPTGYENSVVRPENELGNVLYGILIIEVISQKRIGNITGSDFIAEIIAIPDIDFNTEKINFLLTGLEQTAYIGYPDFATITVLGSRFRRLWERKSHDKCVSILANLRAFYQEEIDSLIISDGSDSADNQLWNEIRIIGTHPDKAKVFSASAVLWPLLDSTTPTFLKINAAICLDLCLAKSIPELFERAAKTLIVALFDMNLMNVLFYEWFRIVDPNWAIYDQFIMPPETGDPNYKAEMRAEYREILETFVKEMGEGFVTEL